MRLRLRDIDSRDRDGFAAFFYRLSPASRLSRFLSPKRELTPRELDYFTDVDQFHHVAIAAVQESDGSIVAISRYVAHPDGPTGQRLLHRLRFKGRASQGTIEYELELT
jgi:hypothetical protein